MAKNQAQKRADKKHRMEKAQRRRAQRMRTIRIWATVVIVAVLGPLLFFLLRDSGGKVSPGSATASCVAAKQGPAPKKYKAPPKMTIDPAKKYAATIETSCGTFTVALDAKNAPKTVNNFVFLSRDGFFNGTIFHRVIADFMIQGGDPLGTGNGDPGYKFEDETKPTDSFAEPGVLAMANSGPATNGSQFFITVAPTPHLNGKHTIFGRVTSGMDVVERIVKVEKGAQDKPVKDVVIKKITIAEK